MRVSRPPCPSPLEQCTSSYTTPIVMTFLFKEKKKNNPGYLIQQIQKASFGNSKETTTLLAATLPGLSLLLWCCREEGCLTNGVAEHAAPPEPGQGVPVLTSPAGLLKAKVSFSAAVTSQPCHPEPLFPSGKIFQILSGCSGRYKQALES